MPVYRAEVTLWSLFPDVADLADPTTGCVYSGFFSAADSGTVFGMAIRAVPDAGSLVGYRVDAQLYFNAAGDPDTWSFISGVSTITMPDDPVFVFPQVWTLAIQKDFDNDTITWIFPWGTQVRGNSSFSDNNSVLRPDGFGNGIILPSLVEASGGTSQWRDFYGYVDNKKFLGAALTSTDPGTWLATVEYDGPIVNTDAQETNDYLMGYSALLPPILDSRRMRYWNGGDNIPVVATEAVKLDAVVNPLTGTLLVASVAEDSPEILEVFRSTDGGATFETVVVSNGLFHDDPSIIALPNGRVVLWYNDGQRGFISYAVSTTDGKTWVTGGLNYYRVVDLYLGTPSIMVVPRFRVDAHGHIWGVWLSEAGALVMQRFPVLGESAYGAVVIDTGITENERPDLWFTSLSGLRVRYRHSATERINGSSDWGAHWNVVNNGRATEVRQSSVTDFKRGLTFHLWQDDSGAFGNTVGHNVSEDGGATFVSGLEGTVASMLDEQYPALALGLRGELYALIWEAGVVVCYVSEDLGHNWNPA